MISSTADPRAGLRRYGYSFVPGALFIVDPTLSAEMKELTKEWENLPPDPYVPLPRTRFRRYSRYLFDPKTSELSHKPNEIYIQRREFNPLYGGLPRVFAPLTSAFVDGTFLRSLIRYNIDQLPLGDDAALDIHVHAVRIRAEGGSVGEPSPEGTHRDGFAFVTVHMFRFFNAVGGHSAVEDSSHSVKTNVRLESPLDTLFIDDRILLHKTSAISQNDISSGPAVRDVLLMSIDYAATI